MHDRVVATLRTCGLGYGRPSTTTFQAPTHLHAERLARCRGPSYHAHVRTLTPDATRRLETHLREVGRGLRDHAVTHVREKGPQDLVSELDLWAERQVTEFLAAQFPGDALLSEESSSQVDYAERIWVLDPLDGTVNRTNGVPFFALSLALLDQGRPAAGFVYDPVHDELFAAHHGRGATLNDAPIAVSQGTTGGVAFTSKLIRRFVRQSPQALVELLTHHGRLRNLGAQALQLCYVACGRLQLAASSETRLWDNAAGALIVREAGGRFTDLAGNDPFPITPGHAALRGGDHPCLAASPAAYERVAPLLSALLVKRRP